MDSRFAIFAQHYAALGGSLVSRSGGVFGFCGGLLARFGDMAGGFVHGGKSVRKQRERGREREREGKSS